MSFGLRDVKYKFTINQVFEQDLNEIFLNLLEFRSFNETDNEEKNIIMKGEMKRGQN